MLDVSVADDQRAAGVIYLTSSQQTDAHFKSLLVSSLCSWDYFHNRPNGLLICVSFLLYNQSSRLSIKKAHFLPLIIAF